MGRPRSQTQVLAKWAEKSIWTEGFPTPSTSPVGGDDPDPSFLSPALGSGYDAPVPLLQYLGACSFVLKKKGNVKAGKRTPTHTGTAEVPLLLQTLVIWLERSSHPHWPKGKRAFSTRDQGSCPHWDRCLPGEGLAVPTHSYNDHFDQSPACCLDPCPQRRGVLEQGTQVLGQSFDTTSPSYPSPASAYQRVAS